MTTTGTPHNVAVGEGAWTSFDEVHDELPSSFDVLGACDLDLANVGQDRWSLGLNDNAYGSPFTGEGGVTDIREATDRSAKRAVAIRTARRVHQRLSRERAA